MQAVSARERAHIVGLTGPPGVGKSTLADALIAHLTSRGRRVGVLAIDPSSPRRGGAILGDRIRMQLHAGDANVFVRSMAARGRLGGLAPAGHRATYLLAAFGFDMVLVETVGTGQADHDVTRLAATTVLVMAPGSGDSVQLLKASWRLPTWWRSTNRTSPARPRWRRSCV